ATPLPFLSIGGPLLLMSAFDRRINSEALTELRGPESVGHQQPRLQASSAESLFPWSSDRFVGWLRPRVRHDSKAWLVICPLVVGPVDGVCRVPSFRGLIWEGAP